MSCCLGREAFNSKFFNSTYLMLSTNITIHIEQPNIHEAKAYQRMGVSRSHDPASQQQQPYRYLHQAKMRQIDVYSSFHIMTVFQWWSRSFLREKAWDNTAFLTTDCAASEIIFIGYCIYVYCISANSAPPLF